MLFLRTSPDKLPEVLSQSSDILCTAVIEGCTKTYYKKFILTDLILIYADHPWMHRLYLFRNNPDLHFRLLPVLSVHLSVHPMLLLLLYTARLSCRFFPEHKSHRSARNFICCFLITVLFMDFCIFFVVSAVIVCLFAPHPPSDATHIVLP